MNTEQYQQLLADIRQIVRQELAMRDIPAAPEKEEDELMNVREVAEALGCSVPTARNRINRGEIPSVVLAGKKFVVRAAFKALYA